eukprot:1959659-Rhodomonas_salina.1
MRRQIPHGTGTSSTLDFRDRIGYSQARKRVLPLRNTHSLSTAVWAPEEETGSGPRLKRRQQRKFGLRLTMLQGRAQPLRDKLGNNQYRHVQERPPSPGAPPSYFEITILDEHELPDNEPDYDLMGAHRDQRPTPR